MAARASPTNFIQFVVGLNNSLRQADDKLRFVGLYSLSFMNFRLGVNYWPINSAMYWWQRFDAMEVARDFARIRAAGFDSVRIFLLWEDFQPAPDLVSRDALSHLRHVADIAADHGLSLIVTFFTGHMSGVNWIPRWALESKPLSTNERFRIVAGGRPVEATARNWYTDPQIIDAQCLLTREVAGALHDHTALWAWDLGNENSNCVVPPSREAGIEWLQRITTEIRSLDAGHPITIGLHMEDLEEDRKIGPLEAATVCDFLCMHGYPIYCRWANGPTDALLLPFLGLITYWLGRREVLFEEFGAPTIPMASAVDPVGDAGPILLSEDKAAAYTARAIELLNRHGLLGGFLWCYGAYSRTLWGLPPLVQAGHERYFGLWREDGSPTPAVAEIQRLSGLRREELRTDLDWLDIHPDEFYERPADNLRRLYQKFRLTYEESATN